MHKLIKLHMKRNLTRIAIALIAVTFSISACKKSETRVTPVTTPQPNPDAVAKQIALSLYNSLTGQMGGTNINDGIKEPSSIASHNGKSLDAVSSLCGYELDTAWQNYSVVNDTTYWTSSKFNFKNLCVLSQNVNGFAAYDSIRTNVSTSAFLNEYTNVQKYTAVALDNTFKVTGVNGSIFTSIANTVYPTGSDVQEYHTIVCDYNLVALVIDLSGSTADIKGGVATYKSSTKDITAGSNQQPVVINYTGNIIFLGNHTAKLTIDPKHYYTINFLTKTITPL